MQGSNNNNNIIPNVSCVFRQLVQLSQKNPRLNSNQQTQNFMQKNPYNNFPNQQLEKRQKFDFVSNMGLDDRQQRHQQLMNRLKNSLEENRQLLGLNQTPKNKYQYQSVNKNTQQFMPYNNFNSKTNSHQSYSNSLQNNQVRNNQSKKWSIPQIKYRHIEDVQQKTSPKNSQLLNQSSQQDFIIESQTQSKLQKQFYGQSVIQPNIKQNPNKNIRKQSQQRNNQNYKTKTQEFDQDQNQIDQQLVNKYSKFSNKPSKYNENLQSYYELCRKPIKPPMTISGKQSIKQSIKSNEQKFIRKPQQKIGGINLSKAIQILSLDD